MAWAGKFDLSTIDIRLAAIAFFHRTIGLADPTADAGVRVVLKGIRHELGTAPSKKAPVMLDELEALIEASAGVGLASKRDRALILLGWAGAFRRSELVALEVADVHIGERVIIQIRKSKTDQDGKGKIKVIPPIGGELCPVQALRDWLQASGINSGPLFRAVDRWGHVRGGRLGDKTVARVVKKVAERAGLEPRQFAGHSLRSGFTTQAAIGGAQSRDIMELTGHKSEAVMRGYIQDAGLGAMSAVRAAFGRK
jgi:integrase